MDFHEIWGELVRFGTGNSQLGIYLEWSLASGGSPLFFVFAPNSRTVSTADIRATCRLVAFRVSHIDDARCISVMRICLCVCLSATAFPHYCTDPDVTWGIVGVPSSCALLGEFAIGARVIALLRQHRAECEMSASACTRSMPG